ncbi:hypothetical protein [Fodinibius salsisoli]|uniref:Polymerase/histidinol phosphatase N-terminal domain-containing protein n=1 Tax=Fodinibius salsisoli TaxID=2820877 RepID=A0ABT3PQN0_9BACT|nr:hypothetical protein [Fodinibius salsisoli]MCW9708172.1 hypothetical protein [Fodinibius salsisoli]
MDSKKQASKWYKGNLHTHSLWSDGDDYPEMIMKWYKDHGYNFVALSDHNILAEGEKWIEIKKGSDQEKQFNEYLQTFGGTLVNYQQTDSLIQVQLKTLQEYRTLFEKEGEFLVIKSEEITDGYKQKPIHVNATNIEKLIKPQGGKSVVDVMQNNIDAVNAQRDSTGKPMIPHLNHPNFGWAVTAEDIKQLTGEHFFEVYNGHPLVHNYGDSLHSGMEEIWDQVLTHYLQHDKGMMYGIAVDDSHHYHEFDSAQSNPGRGWIMVRADSLTPAAIISALENGSFYSSTGVEFSKISDTADELMVEVKSEEGVSYEIQFWGTLTFNPDSTGILLEKATGTQARYTFTGDELYVRAKVVSDKPKKNPYKAGEVEVAWAQPVTPGQ